MSEKNSLLKLLGNHAATNLFSLENKNLFAAGPQKKTMLSPNKEVRNMSEEYFFFLSQMNLSGWPFRPSRRNCRVSPIIGHPTFPGGRFGILDLRLRNVKKQKRKMRVTDVQSSKPGNRDGEKLAFS